MCVKSFHADAQRNAFFIGWLLPLLVACVSLALSLSLSLSLACEVGGIE